MSDFIPNKPAAPPKVYEKTYEQDEMPAGPSRSISTPDANKADKMPRTASVGKGRGALAAIPESVFRGVDGMLDKFLGEHASTLRSNKPLLFGLAGFMGAAFGALIAEVVPHLHLANARIGESLYTGLYSGVVSGVLAPFLWLAGEYYLRRMEVHWRVLVKPIVSGAAAGVLAGGLAGFLYGSAYVVEYWREILLRPICWGAMGVMLGWRLSSFSPNLSVARSLAGGAMGGVVGGVAFLFTAILFPQFIGRIIGFGVMGAALGLALVAVDSLFRDAVLEVIWARNEITHIPLGPRPVYIGGGDDHVSIAGLSEHAISLTFDKGQILYVEKASGKKTPLKDGTRIKIGRVELAIHAKQAPTKTAAQREEEY